MYAQQPPVYVTPQPQYNPQPPPTNNADLENGANSGDLNVPKNIKEIKGLGSSLVRRS